MQDYGVFPQVWDESQPLPWRLSKDDRDLLNRRVVNMWCPHYRDKLHKNGSSFWKKPKYCWKTKHKLNIFLVFLPTLLRDQVPEFHRAIMKITFALRRLDGLVISIDEAKRIGVEPGCHCLPKGAIHSINEDLILGIVMLEGCVPLEILNTTLHHVLHFGEQSALNGCLRWFWMFVFERYNKRIKGMVKNKHWVAESLATNALMETATRFFKYGSSSGRVQFVRFLGRGRVVRTTPQLKMQLQRLNHTPDQHVLVYKSVRILNCHFKSNEWGKTSCGSVVTSVKHGEMFNCSYHHL